MSLADSKRDLGRLAQEHYGYVLSRIVRSVRDLDVAEEAVQEAFAAAATQWPERGWPDAPRGWLVTTARNKAIDDLRKRTTQQQKADELAWLSSLRADRVDVHDPGQIKDDMLRLIFTCCHPALSQEAQIALTLQTLAGLNAKEVARAFLVAPQTMAQRIVRAKRKIRLAKIPYAVPEPEELRCRLEGVLDVVYLIFNEGYGATSGAQLIRQELCTTAIRLGQSLVECLPDDGEVNGLLALMLLCDSRRAARTSATGDLVLLDDQDRSLWDQQPIELGRKHVNVALRDRPPGRYALQAAIAAVHADAKAPELTDWKQIVALYHLLWRTTPTPVVALNRTVAIAMRDCPEVALPLLKPLEEALSDYYLYHSVHADLLRRCGQLAAARAAYERAIELCENEVELKFLRRRRDAC